MIDLEAMDQSIRERLTAEAPALVSVASAEDVEDEATILSVRCPAAFVELPDEQSEGRKAINQNAQPIEMPIVIGLVTESLRKKAGKGAAGSLALRQAIKKALVGFTPTGAQRALTFASVHTVARLGTRTLTEITFQTGVWETFD